jgi:hypothetical protein
MPRHGKDDSGNAGDHDPPGETAVDKETFREALPKTGFEPAKVGRKIVSQGRGREALKERVSKNPSK